jgi:hypothetical protein
MSKAYYAILEYFQYFMNTEVCYASRTRETRAAEKIQSNKHEVFVVSIEEMDTIIRSSPNGEKPSVQEAWQKIKGKIELGASYLSSADDTVTLTKLIGDLGSVGAKAYVKTYGGKPHIILKGRPGLRKILTGTKYGIKNPKIISMGLGKAAAVKIARQGGIFTVVLLTTYRIVDYFLTDEATLSQLVGTLATDIVKVGITTGASIAAAIAVGAATFAIGPLLAVILVGVGTSILLDEIDAHFKITERVIAGLDELSNNATAYVAQAKQRTKNSLYQTVDSVIDYAIESAKSVAIKWIQKELKQYLSSVPRVY